MNWMPSTILKVRDEAAKFLTQGGGASHAADHHDHHGHMATTSRKTTALEQTMYHPSFTWQDHGCRGVVELLVSSEYFDYLMGFFLLLNAFAIGYSTNHMAQPEQVDKEVPPLFRITDFCFCGIFTLELALRLYAHGCPMYWTKGWQWAWFDTIIVGFQIIDTLTVLIFSGSEFQKSIDDLAVLSMLRLTRIIRLFRMVRLIPELKSMVYLIFASMNAFFWTGVLLCLLMYCVAVYFTESGGKIAMKQDELEAKATREKWGTISSSVLSLFQAITGGDDWNQFLVVFEGDSAHVLNTLVFSVYIAFATLVMLNLVTGVFVEGAQRIIKEDKDMELVKIMYKLFNTADQDHSASISWEEFQEHVEDRGMDEYFKAVDLSSKDAEQLFRLLDSDGSGAISIEEFVRGCLRLRGPARSIDMASLVYDFNARSVDNEKTFVRLEADLQTLTKATTKTLALVSHLLSPPSQQGEAHGEGVLV
jgi:voltage-gated sodium channel